MTPDTQHPTPKTAIITQLNQAQGERINDLEAHIADLQTTLAHINHLTALEARRILCPDGDLLYPRAHIWAALDRERNYQDWKYGPAHDRSLSLEVWQDIAHKELGESITAPDQENALAELLQVAAVCIAAIEAHGLIERWDLEK